MEEIPCFLFSSSKLSSSVRFPRCAQMITSACVRGRMRWIAWCLEGGYSRYGACVRACHLRVNTVECVCACVCVSVSCSSIESDGDQTVSQLL